MEGSHFKDGAQNRAGQRIGEDRTREDRTGQNKRGQAGQDRTGQDRTGQVQRGEEKKGGYLLVALPLLYNMSSLRGFWASADFLQWTDDRKNERSDKRGGEQEVGGGEKVRRGLR